MAEPIAGASKRPVEQDVGKEAKLIEGLAKKSLDG
jgi:hypothetical protein